MACLQIDDVRSIFVAVMKLELVYSEEPCLFFRFDKFAATIRRIEFLEAFLVNRFNGVLSKPGDFGNLLVCLRSSGKQVTNILEQSIRNEMSICLKGNMLAFGSLAMRTAELVMRE